MSVSFYGILIFRVGFVLGMRFRKCVLPKGLANEPPQIMQIHKCLDVIGYTMVSIISYTMSMPKTQWVHLNTFAIRFACLFLEQTHETNCSIKIQ